ncbi:MAG TPA: hypothetical protein VFY87_30845 [Geminicoccaceae bacterium]|nr:hypothetical protein [Geminicoccaceae bacterium]
MSQPDETRVAAPATDDAPSGPVMAESTRSASTELAPPPRRGGSGFLAGLIGGLLGTAAVLAVAGWYAYERGPVRPALARLEATESTARGAESNVAALRDQVGQVGQDLGRRVDRLGQDLVGLRDTLARTDAAVASLSDRAAASEKATSDLAATVEQANNSFRSASEQVISRLEAVNAKLVEVEQSQPADVVDKRTVADVAAKQSGIEQAQQQLSGELARLEQLVAQSLDAGNQQAAALRVVVDNVQSRLAEIGSQQRDLLPLKGELAQQQQADEQQRAALAGVEGTIGNVRTGLEQRLEQVTARLTQLDAARERSVGLSLATHNLETALETGQPFRPTVEILDQLGQGDEVVSDAVAKLEPMAAGGVPTSAELARQLDDVERSLSAPEAGTQERQDWLARTQENLRGLVNLHPAGEEAVPGEDAVQAASRALEQQDLQGAVAALQPLAERGNEQAQAWLATARNRLDALAAAETLREHVKTMLTQQG